VSLTLPKKRLANTFVARDSAGKLLVLLAGA